MISGFVTASIGFRRLGGKLAYLDHLGAGKPRQHFLHPRIGLGGALALVFLHLVLRTQRRRSGFVGARHGPAPPGPLLWSAREIVDRGSGPPPSPRALTPPAFAAYQTHIDVQSA